ncbi:hypothetical protein P7K49_009025 [Saguinus oedipus]|uniref:Uncharacterized protein n=1 Tax=Saguinus oedipus TaxID=9490 RepID=A0ABQ9W120_SAGOE|nr:hypothetical protein P7K49_009025 [Saguinus oedipus]
MFIVETHRNSGSHHMQCHRDAGDLLVSVRVLSSVCTHGTRSRGWKTAVRGCPASVWMEEASPPQSSFLLSVGDGTN